MRRATSCAATGISETSIEIVWDAIALHTTPGIPEHKKAEVALVTSGVEMDVLGIAYEQFPDGQAGRGGRGRIPGAITSRMPSSAPSTTA